MPEPGAPTAPRVMPVMRHVVPQPIVPIAVPQPNPVPLQPMMRPQEILTSYTTRKNSDRYQIATQLYIAMRLLKFLTIWSELD